MVTNILVPNHAQERIERRAATNATITIAKIGWWSAILTSLIGAGYGIAVIVYMASILSTQTSSAAQGWAGIEAFVAEFQPIQMLAVIPSLMLVPAFTAAAVYTALMFNRIKSDPSGRG
jgi:hypothetical protein